MITILHQAELSQISAGISAAERVENAEKILNKLDSWTAQILEWTASGLGGVGIAALIRGSFAFGGGCLAASAVVAPIAYGVRYYNNKPCIDYLNKLHENEI